MNCRKLSIQFFARPALASYNKILRLLTRHEFGSCRTGQFSAKQTEKADAHKTVFD